MNVGNNQQAGTFLPQDYVKGKSEQRANIFVLTLFVVVMLGTGAAFALNLQRQRAVAAENREVTAQFEAEHTKFNQLKELQTKREELMDSAELVTALIDRVPRSVLLAELTRSMPSGLALTTVQLEGERYRPPPTKPVAPGAGTGPKVKSLTDPSGGAAAAKPKVVPPRFEHTLMIEGVAGENTEIADYMAALKASPLLREVELQFIKQTVENDVDLRKFRITATLRPDADATGVAGAAETTLIGDDAPEGERAFSDDADTGIPADEVTSVPETSE